MIKLIGLIAIIAWMENGYSQTPVATGNSAVNNLVMPQGYVPGVYEAIPQYVKKGTGARTLILIPGWGFDASVFEDFMVENRKNYTMYAITIPGYGNTSAPPLPDSGTSYGNQYWNNGVLLGIRALIVREKLRKPVIVGHSTQGTQLALRMAIAYPEMVSGVIVLGGHAKFIYVSGGNPQEYPLPKTIDYVDKYTAPFWFKTISRQRFDEGNFLPEIYSLDTLRAQQLWKMAASVPLPVMVQYICEFFASDIKTEIHRIKCPVLVLRSTFNSAILNAPINNYVKPQFIDAWTGVSLINPLVKVVDIMSAATFVWKDNPKEVYRLISEFLKGEPPDGKSGY